MVCHGFNSSAINMMACFKRKKHQDFKLVPHIMTPLQFGDSVMWFHTYTTYLLAVAGVGARRLDGAALPAKPSEEPKPWTGRTYVL